MATEVTVSIGEVLFRCKDGVLGGYHVKTVTAVKNTVTGRTEHVYGDPMTAEQAEAEGFSLAFIMDKTVSDSLTLMDNAVAAKEVAETSLQLAQNESALKDAVIAAKNAEIAQLKQEKP